MNWKMFYVKMHSLNPVYFYIHAFGGRFYPKRLTRYTFTLLSVLTGKKVTYLTFTNLSIFKNCTLLKIFVNLAPDHIFLHSIYLKFIK